MAKLDSFARLAALAFGATIAVTAPSFAQDAAEPSAEETPALSDYDAATTLATVGARAVTLGDLITARQALPPQISTLEDGAVFDGLLEQLVQQTLFAEAGDELGLGDQAYVQAQLAAAQREILAQAYVIYAIEPKLTDEYLREVYDARIAEVEPEEEVRARHILLETEEAAKEIKTKLDEGGDFEALAKEHSTGPSGPDGGDLGFFRKQMMVAPFAEAAFAMEPGGVSEPVQTQFGWHVIKLEERRPVAPPSFEQLQEQIRRDAARELAQQEIAKLREKSTVEMTSPRPPVSAIREDDLLTSQPQ